MLSASSALKMETVCFSETVVSSYESTLCENPEEERHHPPSHENFKSHKLFQFSFLVLFRFMNMEGADVNLYSTVIIEFRKKKYKANQIHYVDYS
jgi:hypothetical protein